MPKHSQVAHFPVKQEFSVHPERDQALYESFNQVVMAHKFDQQIGACDRVLQPSGTHPLSSDVESESNKRYPNLGKGLRIVKKGKSQPSAKGKVIKSTDIVGDIISQGRSLIDVTSRA